MADTVCDFKSFLANFSPQSVEMMISGVSVPEPHSSTPADSKSQAVPAPIPKALEAAVHALVENAWNLHSSSNGATVSLEDGNMTGQKLFAVSVYPERTVEFRNPPRWQDVAAFAALNLNLLLGPGHAFGSWFNEPKHTYVFDVVVCLADRRTALELGRKFNQVSIFDLENLQEIMIEGSEVPAEAAHSQISIFDLLTNKKEVPVTTTVAQERPPGILTTSESAPSGLPPTA